MWPQKWGHIFAAGESGRIYPLEKPPYKMRQKHKQRKHKDSANPDQKVQRPFGIVNLLFVHASG
jgi:hypothetical protein